MRRLLLLPLIAGCGGDQLFLERPWAADQTVVLLAVDANGDPSASPSISTGAKIDLMLEVEPPFSIFAWVFAPVVLAPSCNVAIGGEGVSISSQSEVWKASIEDLGKAALFAPSEAPALDLKTTCTIPTPCPKIDAEVQPIDQLLGGNVIAIVPLSATKLLAANDQTKRIVEIDGDRARLLDTSRLNDVMRTLARAGDTIYGSTRSEVFRFDLSDEIIEVETSTIQRGLELVPSGAPVVYGKFGIREVFTAETGTAAIERGLIDVRQVRMIARDEGLLVDEMSMIYHFRGVSWAIETPGASGLVLESFRRIDGDRTSFMAVGKRENAFVRRDGVWEQLPLPFNGGITFNDVKSLGDDRFLVIGEFGSVALRQDGMWCTYELVPQRSLHRVVATDDPNVLLIGTDPDAGGVPSLFRITLQ